MLAFASANETTLFDFKALLSWKVHCTSLLYWSDKHRQTERDREEKRRSQKRKMENGITAKERWREMTHLLSIHPFTVRMNNYHTHSSLFTIDALAFVTCVAHTHTHSHFIFVMCNDVPTFYMWTRKGIEVCGLDQFTHWLQLHIRTHKFINMYVHIKCLVEWVEIKFHHGRFRHCDGADDTMVLLLLLDDWHRLHFLCTSFNFSFGLRSSRCVVLLQHYFNMLYINGMLWVRIRFVWNTATVHATAAAATMRSF